MAIAITDIWMWSPFVMLLSLAGLSAIPPSLYEAAAIDRASRWFVFWRITLPLVSPLLLIAIIFRTMEAFKTFDIAYVMASMDETELVAIKLSTRWRSTSGRLALVRAGLPDAAGGALRSRTRTSST